MNIINGQCEISQTGLNISDDLSYAEWEAVGFELAKAGRSMQWWVGDWVNYGGKRYGETYKAAIEATGMSLGAVQNMASVCRGFEASRRREVLSFKHHVEVCSLPTDKQEEILDRAEKESLPASKVREIVRSINHIKSTTKQSPSNSIGSQLVAFIELWENSNTDDRNSILEWLEENKETT